MSIWIEMGVDKKNGGKTKDKHILYKASRRADAGEEAGRETREERQVEVNIISKRLVPLRIVVPTSILETEPTLLLKTLTASYLIRAAAVFRVEDVIIYNDGSLDGEKHRVYARIIEDVHKYLITPPYLRRILIPIKKNLRYIGAAPPLRINIFDVSGKPRLGEIRLGYVLGDRGNSGPYRVLLGDVVAYRLRGYRGDPGKFIIVRIKSTRPPVAVYEQSLDKDVYKGPRLTVVEKLLDAIRHVRDKECLLIATSRWGSPATPGFLCNRFTRILYKNRKGCVSVFFGGPRRGLYEIAEREGYVLDDIMDYVLNTIIQQGVRTVRTLEAVYATLALINPFIP